MALVFCITMLFPTVGYAVDSSDAELPYGITSDESEFTATALGGENESLKMIKEKAEKYQLGEDMNEYFNSTYGNLLSPFELQSSEDYITFSIDVPDNASENVDKAFKLAVQGVRESGVAPIHFYQTDLSENEQTLTVGFPMLGNEKVVCALVQYDEMEQLPVFTTSETTMPETVLENTNGTSFEYRWSFKLNNAEGIFGTNLSGVSYVRLTTSQISVDLGGLTLDKESVKLLNENGEESGLFSIDTSAINQETDGTWIIPLTKPSDKDANTPLSDAGLFDSMTLSFTVSVPEGKFVDKDQVAVIADLILIHNLEGGNYLVETSPFTSSDLSAMKSAVNITPADMTIYEGGNGGYEGVVGADGEVIEEQTSLPHPLFYIEGSPVAGLENLDGVQFTADQGEDGIKTWTVVRDGTDKDGKALYHFVEADGTEPVRVTYSYYDEDQQKTVTVMEDDFDAQAIGDSYRELDINIFNGANAEDFSNVTATIGETKGVALNVHSGTLTVRAVDAEDPATVTTPVADSTNAEGFTAPQTGQAVAVVPEGQTTTYTLNDTGVALPAGSAPSLLFDSIIDEIPGDATTTRTALLQAAVDTKLGGAVDGRQYDIKYLDLVDANNGNAWITSSAGVDVYWGYPDGTDKDTEFKLIHFPGLHRDGTESGFDPDDLTSMAPEDMEEVQIISQDEYGIKFHVGAGGFSPFALVWDPVDEPSPGPDPDPSPGPGPVDPVDPTPELERGDHYAYIVGYEDDTIRPQNNITRAEVATIFFRLLTDESREAYFTTDCDFTDVNGSAWYANTVATLSNAGILAGYPDGSFRPNDPITRAEFAAIATRFDDLAAADSTFTDIDGHWAEDAINAAYGAGWVGGYPDGTFRPNNNITRAEVMSLVNRVLDREVDEDGMLDDMLTWIDNEPGTWYYEAVQEATNSHDYEREDADSVETWTQINEPIDWDAVEEELVNSH